MDRITLQLLLALAMLIATVFAGLTPLKLLKVITKKQDDGNGRRAAWVLTLLSCFAGGVFMGTCFLDIFPHINSNYARFRKNAGWVDYPFPEFFVCCGFFLVYLLEELALKVFTHQHPHSHGARGLTRSDIEPNNLKIHQNGKNQNKSITTHRNESENELTRPKKISVMTHEMVIDESIKYVSGDTIEIGFLKSLTFTIAMSFHSILEGFALGVQDDNTGIMTLFISLLIHKCIEAFSVGLQVSKSNSKRLAMATLTILIYSMMTPLGSLLGVLITNLNIDELLKEGIIIVLESLAGGTFIYITFFEVLAQERANDHSNLIQLNAIVIGFLVIAALQLNEHFGQVHGHGDHGNH